MPPIKGRRPRPSLAPAALVQARIAPELKDQVSRAAKATGLSISAYIEQLIAHEQLDDDDRPLWWTDDPSPDQEELPLTKAS